ncbi:MAG: MinD/ParA family protein [Cyanothece sp. SIO1E1]|nr:MinD/ParA family protein [Cyanothece sp. SIO1E1]
MPKVVAVHSYRGGTGKSNLTANLATAVALQGQRVAVIDTDLQSPGIHALFGLDGANMGKTLNDYLWGRHPIEDIAHDVSSSLGAASQNNFFLVPSSVNAEEIARILSEGYSVSLLNDGFRKLVRGLQLDYLFIDTHPGLSKETFLSIAISNILILILRPDRQDFQGTAVTVDVARQLKVQKMMLVVNKALTRMDFLGLKQKIEATYDVPVVGVFPLSEDMVQLASHGIFLLEYPNHPFSQEISQVAMQILN